ncbi:SAM-dependent methyltransferase [Nocardia nepalensis]|uniref:SAM-dependent methyltransferase n=1 Tax=Nocardia nepalensis TaxID=3375448 RepID=UPI003B67E8AD
MGQGALPAPGNRVRHVYDVVGPQTSSARTHCSLGYRRDQPDTLDEASRDLTRLVVREAELGPDNIRLDVVFGYGNQDFLWANEFRSKQTIGMTIATEQIEIASRRAAELELEHRIHYEYGSAVDLPREDEFVTKVTVLELPLHFPSYTRFFTEEVRRAAARPQACHRGYRATPTVYRMPLSACRIAHSSAICPPR